MNGFSSRFLKVYPEINEMPSWSDTSMPEGILEEWERIIRKVVGIDPPTDQEGKADSIELPFSHGAKLRVTFHVAEIFCQHYSEFSGFLVNLIHARFSADAAHYLYHKAETNNMAVIVKFELCGDTLNF